MASRKRCKKGSRRLHPGGRCYKISNRKSTGKRCPKGMRVGPDRKCHRTSSRSSSSSDSRSYGRGASKLSRADRIKWEMECLQDTTAANPKCKWNNKGERVPDFNQSYSDLQHRLKLAFLNQEIQCLGVKDASNCNKHVFCNWKGNTCALSNKKEFMSILEKAHAAGVTSIPLIDSSGAPIGATVAVGASAPKAPAASAASATSDVKGLLSAFAAAPKPTQGGRRYRRGVSGGKRRYHKLRNRSRSRR